VPTLTLSLITAAFTAFLGAVVFVVGHFVVRFVVAPIQEQARAIGGVTHALTYYANLYEDTYPDVIEEGSRVYRTLAAGLHSGVRVIPCYGIFARLG
jgi:hypothetical protein